MTASLDHTIQVKQYFRMFWRRRGLILLCSVTVFCTALISLEFVPVEYRSTATLTVESRQRLASELQKLMGGMMDPDQGYGYDDRQMAEIIARVRSQPFLERVVRLLKMNEDPLVLKQARAALATRNDVSLEQLATRIVVGRLRSKISFETQGAGNYKIIVSDSNPVNARLLARWISELFVDISTQNSVDQLKRVHEFGAEQLKIYEQQLVRSEQALEQYKQTQIEQNLDRSVVHANNAAVAEALYQRALDEAERSRLRMLPFARSLSDADVAKTKDQLLADPQIQSQGRGLVAALKDAITDRLLGDHPGVGDWPPTGTYVSLRRGLMQSIESRTNGVPPNQSNEPRDSLARLVFATLDREALTGAAEFLGNAISDFKRQAQSVPRGEMELARLQAEVATNRELLSSFRSQLIATDVSQAVETTNLNPRIEILDPPQVPLVPSSPNRMMVLLAALGMGPILGLGVALATEVVDSTLRSLSDFERVFKGPVLGTTPLLSRVPQQPARLRRYWVPATLTAVVLVTALLFVTRATILRNFVTVGDTVKGIDPEESVTR
jgi:uncharacterized protein involved in exopolysaccharide biosynthesis